MKSNIKLTLSSKEAYNLFTGKSKGILRKNLPKDFIGWVYIYIKKSDRRLSMDWIEKSNEFGEKSTLRVFSLSQKKLSPSAQVLNGLIVGKFWYTNYYPVIEHTSEELKKYHYTVNLLGDLCELISLDNTRIKLYLKGEAGLFCEIPRVNIFREFLKLEQMRDSLGRIIARPYPVWGYASPNL